MHDSKWNVRLYHYICIQMVGWLVCILWHLTSSTTTILYDIYHSFSQFDCFFPFTTHHSKLCYALFSSFNRRQIAISFACLWQLCGLERLTHGTMSVEEKYQRVNITYFVKVCTLLTSTIGSGNRTLWQLNRLHTHEHIWLRYMTYVMHVCWITPIGFHAHRLIDWLFTRIPFVMACYQLDSKCCEMR